MIELEALYIFSFLAGGFISMDSDPDNLWLQLLLLVFLTALNAFFAGAEMALVSASPSKL